MLLLATQAEPQMIEHAHPNLGRLVQPRHYNALPATIARGVPWAADNDCYQHLDKHAYYAMLDHLHHIGGRCLLSPCPTWWPTLTRRHVSSSGGGPDPHAAAYPSPWSRRTALST
jgi:hypothetical protein